ncbi:MAG: hypothetical protein AB8H80_15375 [Planctomycetota bacterium]
MRYLPLTLALALCCAPAKADKFWLSDPKAETKAPEGSTPNIVTGVLIAEGDEGYHVRIEGGEILLPKASVFKIEKDELSIDDIVDAEAKAAEAGKKANDARRLAQKTAAKEREIRVAEAAAARRSLVRRAADAGMRLDERFPGEDVANAAQTGAVGFDPVLGVSRAEPSHFVRMRAAKLAWEMTRDRSYLKMLRRLRRLR